MTLEERGSSKLRVLFASSLPSFQQIIGLTVWTSASNYLYPCSGLGLLPGMESFAHSVYTEYLLASYPEPGAGDGFLACG